MITTKEKTALRIIYIEYQKNKDSDKMYMKTDNLINKSQGRLSLPDLQGLILHGNSRYIGFQDVAGSVVKISPEGIAYMEGKLARTISSIAFWVFGISSVVAGIYAVLTYYLK